MPFVHIATSVTLSDAQKKELYGKLTQLMPILPGKTIDNTMVRIDDGADFYMGGAAKPLAFVDLRLFKPSPESAKAEFVAAICALLTEYGVPQGGIYMNLVEMPSWGSSGGYSS